MALEGLLRAKGGVSRYSLPGLHRPDVIGVQLW